MRRLLWGLAASVWFGLVFLLALWLTFPGAAVAERVMWEWDDKVSQDIKLELGTVRPAPPFVGVRAKDVALYSVERDTRRRRTDEDEAEEPAEVREMVSFDALVVHVGLLDYLRDDLHITGTARMGKGDVDFDFTSAQDEDGDWLLRQAELDAKGFPISAVPPIQGAKLVGEGTVDLEVDIDAVDGLGKSDGTMSIVGRDLVITAVEHPLLDAFLEGVDLDDIEVHELDLEFDVTQGRARVKLGRLTSSVADVGVEGDIILNDALSRIRFRLKFVIDISEDFAFAALAKAALKSSEWSDGKYHYSMSGAFSRVRFKPDRERRSRRREPGDDDLERDRPPRDRVGKTPEELEEDREERRRRREERLAERRGRLSDRIEPRRPGEEQELEPQDEEPEFEDTDDREFEREDEPPDDDQELPPEDLAIPENGQEFFDE